MKDKQYLLDTNILIEIMEGNPTVIEHLMVTGVASCYMSSISLHELYFGAHLAREKKEEYYVREIKKINKLIEFINVLPVSDSGSLYGQIKQMLRSEGLMIDEFDIIIAAQALCEDLTVVTDNLKHFNRISGLKLENWM